MIRKRWQWRLEQKLREEGTCPDMDRSFALDINGMTVEGKLTLTFSYNRKQYREETIKSLA
ncbi:hypothetical protein [Ruminiclostridium cellobioparum]|uniref:hypothetical protein n=1 Tax=Ruminiclostridium cellobioparum TaxID=29355 RepID=UPI00138E2055|nr:hypothetical protein [Ruminiclostridium cellobioparum]